jgi:hypothetical protein
MISKQWKIGDTSRFNVELPALYLLSFIDSTTYLFLAIITEDETAWYANSFL